MNDIVLAEAEHIDDLQFNGARIILSDNLPKFSTDAVLLSAFCDVTESEKLADLGSGTGIISLLVNARTNASVVGFEISPELSNLFERSILLNGRSEQMLSVCCDFCDAYKSYNGAFDACVCNPPYFDVQNGFVSDNAQRAVSRTKLSCSLADICTAASRLLRSGGRLYMCYPADKLVDILYCLRNARLEPKRLRFVRTKSTKAPYLVLIEAKKDGGVAVKIDNDLVLLTENGAYSNEANAIYHR